MATWAWIEAVSVWLELSIHDPVHAPSGLPSIEHTPVMLHGTFFHMVMQLVGAPFDSVPFHGLGWVGGVYIHCPLDVRFNCVTCSAPFVPVGAPMVQVRAPSVSLSIIVRTRESP